MSEKSQKIQVAVRKRPANSREKLRGDPEILSQRSPHTLVVRESRVKVDLTKFIEESHFTFDRVFSEDTSNEELYAAMLQPLIQAAFCGTKVTCFAYGQTGSGKTFTMMGENEHPGLYVLASSDLFAIRAESYPSAVISVSFFEIYCEKLHDLLNGRNQLFAREDAKQTTNIVGLQRKPVANLCELLEIIQLGLTERTTGTTGANDSSSRSHAVLEILIRDHKRTLGKISFIDLAGSERGADVNNSDSKTRVDSAEINKSLLALKECIRALDQDKKHTPFRGSKLTQVLKDSFVGNCRTLMIANVSPCMSSCEHTLNTLRYSDRVKELGKSENRTEPSNLLMLPRQQNNIVRYSAPEGDCEAIPSQKSRIPAPKTPKKIEEMTSEHQSLISTILSEEDELIVSHRKMIDAMVELIKHQMGLLSEVNKPGSNIYNYIEQLESVLDMKEGMIADIKRKLRNFKTHLKQENSYNKRQKTHLEDEWLLDN